jgi:hypothetical protein
LISAYTSGRVAAFVFLTCLIYSGCSGTSRVVESPLYPSYNISREGLLRYKVPVGWFDATHDSQSVATEIWLVKNDYAATITVGRITVDAETRRAIDREGLARLAHLTMTLAGETSSATLLQPPTMSTVNGRDVYSYVVVSPSSNDTTRVVLIDTGENVFEVIGLVPGNQRRVSSSEVFSAQESFLKSLRW